MKVSNNVKSTFHVRLVLFNGLFFLGLILLPFKSFSAVLTVGAGKMYLTIQGAIDAAQDGDEIIVYQGTYVENILFMGKNIVLRSENPKTPFYVNNTIIDGNSSGHVVTFSGCEETSCVLSGFTITKGKDYYGGGIYGNYCHATIQFNTITSNTALMAGGGLAHCHGNIRNNIIQWNKAENDVSNPTWGGGLAECNGLVQNNLIHHNSANMGAAISGRTEFALPTGCGTIDCSEIFPESFDPTGIFINNTIVDNIGETFTPALPIYSYGSVYGYHGMIVNCIIWGNICPASDQMSQSVPPLYSCIQGWAGAGRGNIISDPQFVNPGSVDYHLQSSSPCIDAGNMNYLLGDLMLDADAQVRIAAAGIDMGWDEYGSIADQDGDLLPDTVEPTHGSNILSSDTDGDGLIDGIEVLRGTSPIIFTPPSGISVPGDVSSIQKGLFFAFPDETVTVSPGSWNENLLFSGKNIALISSGPTFIDGGNANSVILFSGKEQESCLISGFTIHNGYAIMGAGINANHSKATIQYCIIWGNQATAFQYFGIGGGIYGSHGVIQLCDIMNNTVNSWESGGGGLANCYGDIMYCNITDNHAYTACGGGSGLVCCSGTITACEIYDNTLDAWLWLSADYQLCHCSIPTSQVGDWFHYNN